MKNHETDTRVRLKALERSHRTQRRLLLTLAATLAAIVFVAATSAPPDVVKAKRLELIDSQGNRVASFGVMETAGSDGGYALLQMSGPAGGNAVIAAGKAPYVLLTSQAHTSRDGRSATVSLRTTTLTPPGLYVDGDPGSDDESIRSAASLFLPWDDSEEFMSVSLGESQLWPVR